jgi:hypothetical protein
MIPSPELTGVTMGNLFWLTDEQKEPLKPFFPQSHGKPRVDGRGILSGWRRIRKQSPGRLFS